MLATTRRTEGEAIKTHSPINLEVLARSALQGNAPKGFQLAGVLVASPHQSELLVCMRI